jgi:hypothetical protein
VRRKVKDLGKALRNISSLLIGNRQVLGMLILVFLCQLGFDAGPLMLAIYVSKRYGWTFSDVSAYLSFFVWSRSTHIDLSSTGKFSKLTRDERRATHVDFDPTVPHQDLAQFPETITKHQRQVHC